MTARMMASFPPAADGQVTLANWRQHPFSRWSFRNVRELLPTANIARAPAPSPLSFAPIYLEDVSFATSGRALAESLARVQSALGEAARDDGGRVRVTAPRLVRARPT